MMSFNHRMIWSTRYVMQREREQGLSEKAAFGYFLAYVILDLLSRMLILLNHSASQNHLPILFVIVSDVIGIGGIVYSFWCNGGASGRRFFPRYLALHVTVGWKYLVWIFALIFLFSCVFSGIALVWNTGFPPTQSELQWAVVIIFYVPTILLYWRIGQHLRSLAGNVTKNDVANEPHQTTV